MSDKWSQEEAAEMVKKATAATTVEATDVVANRKTEGNKKDIMRRAIVVGLGDGGCNIASAIRKSVKNILALTYNTSDRGMDKIVTDEMIIPKAEDGSGKARSYSQDLFRKNIYQHVIDGVNNLAADKTIDFIFVVSTADGGTGGGISPMVAKLLSDNTEIPVIIIGVYPDTAEDAMAQYNALQWQMDVAKTGLPYLLFDNTDKENPAASRKLVMHQRVNQSIVDVMKIIIGEPFGETNISQIDNRDIYMLLYHLGNRIVVAYSNNKPTINQELDEYFLNLIHSSGFYQLEPSDVKGIGLFIKAPKIYLESVSTGLNGIRSKYGEPLLQYVHMEEADTYSFALMMTGCSEPAERLLLMRNRYEDVKAYTKNSSFSLAMATDGMNDLVGRAKSKSKGGATSIDLSALDL